MMLAICPKEASFVVMVGGRACIWIAIIFYETFHDVGWFAMVSEESRTIIDGLRSELTKLKGKLSQQEVQRMGREIIMEGRSRDNDILLGSLSSLSASLGRTEIMNSTVVRSTRLIAGTEAILFTTVGAIFLVMMVGKETADGVSAKLDARQNRTLSS